MFEATMAMKDSLALRSRPHGGAATDPTASGLSFSTGDALESSQNPAGSICK
jgi:hypothetical protein